MSVSQSLIDLLRCHRPADDIGRVNVERTLKFLAAAADPLNRNNYDPGHAVGSALLTDRAHKHIGLVMHAKLHRWLQPGGHADVGEENLLIVSRREALEEVGCNLDEVPGTFCDIDVHLVPPRKNEPGHLHFDFRYLFETPLTPMHPASDALEARWFTLDEALKLDPDAGMRRMIGKLRGG